MAFKCTSCKYWDAIYPKSEYCAKGKAKDKDAYACDKYQRALKKYDPRRKWSIGSTNSQ